MTKPFQPAPAPEGQARDEARTRCSRACCFTPYGCAKQRKCNCHATETNDS